MNDAAAPCDRACGAMRGGAAYADGFDDVRVAIESAISQAAGRGVLTPEVA